MWAGRGGTYSSELEQHHQGHEIVGGEVVLAEAGRANEAMSARRVAQRVVEVPQALFDVLRAAQGPRAASDK